MFKAQKEFIDIEVTIHEDRVFVTSLVGNTNLEKSLQLIARSEQALAQMFIDEKKPVDGVEDLKRYFIKRGWIINGQKSVNQ